MEGELSLWLVRHAVVDGIAGTIHASDALADLSDRPQLDALRRQLPRMPEATQARPGGLSIRHVRSGLIQSSSLNSGSRILATGPGGAMTISLPLAATVTERSGATPPAHDRRAEKALRIKSPGFDAASSRSRRVRRTS